MATPVSDRSGEWQQQALCGWRDKHDVETADDACRTGKAMLGALMERRNTERYEPCSDAE